MLKHPQLPSGSSQLKRFRTENVDQKHLTLLKLTTAPKRVLSSPLNKMHLDGREQTSPLLGCIIMRFLTEEGSDAPIRNPFSPEKSSNTSLCFLIPAPLTPGLLSLLIRLETFSISISNGMGPSQTRCFP